MLVVRSLSFIILLWICYDGLLMVDFQLAACRRHLTVDAFMTFIQQKYKFLLKTELMVYSGRTVREKRTRSQKTLIRYSTIKITVVYVTYKSVRNICGMEKFLAIWQLCGRGVRG